MTDKEITLAAINHKETGIIPVDCGSTGVTGIHVKAVEALRKYYGLEKKPVKVIEPYQMLGEVDEELARCDRLHSSGYLFKNRHVRHTPRQGMERVQDILGSDSICA